MSRRSYDTLDAGSSLSRALCSYNIIDPIDPPIQSTSSSTNPFLPNYSCNSFDAVPSYLFCEPNYHSNPFLSTNPFIPIQPSDSSSSTDLQPEQTFSGQFVRSKFGKNESILFILRTNQSLCYMFSFKRKNAKYVTYYCTGCKGNKKDIVIKAVNSIFLADPSSLLHICTPYETAKQLADRIVYEDLATLKSDHGLGITPRSAWCRTLQKIENNCELPDLLKMEVKQSFYGGGAESRRRAYSRALNSKENTVHMLSLPSHLTHLHDGTTFLQYQAADAHVYFSKKSIELAANIPLKWLLADGVHGYTPADLGRSGQLYTIHCAFDADVCVPIVYAITARKTKRFYKYLFQMLRDELQKCMSPEKLESITILLDYEKASISAAQEVFGKENVEGCSFHFSQACNRARDRLGLRQHLEDEEELHDWYKRMIAMLFLPEDLRDVAIQLLPTSVKPEAQNAVEKFLKYFNDNWMSGFYKDLWCKWKKCEHRSTNLCESFHRKLTRVLCGGHPQMGVLIQTLQNLDLEAYLEMKRHAKNLPSSKNLKRVDVVRREEIGYKMLQFERILENGPATREDISNFLSAMTEHVTTKSHA